MKKRRAFTLIELLVSISVCAVLVGISIHFLAPSRELSRLDKCRANLRSLATQVAFYVDTHAALPVALYEDDEAHLLCPSAREPDLGEYHYPPLLATGLGPAPATTWFGRIQGQNPAKVAVVGCVMTVPNQPRHAKAWHGYLDGGSR